MNNYFNDKVESYFKAILKQILNLKKFKKQF